MNDYGARLFDQHQQLLRASAISPEVADARGYVSVDVKTRLERVGIVKAGRNVPGLLIPIWSAAGEIVSHQYRPDHPRIDAAGRPVKYETPFRAALRVDVPPPVRHLVSDPDVPLYVTEGARKADAAASAGLACVSLSGVDCWQSKGAALPDWSDIPLRGRQVHIAFDSDVMVKESVRKALTRFARWLDYRGANVFAVYLPADADAKVGLDDWFAAGGHADQLPELTRPWDDQNRLIGSSPSTPPNNTATPQHRRSTGVPTFAVLRRILDAVAEEVRDRGLVGEEKLAQTLYLVLTSRLLDKQVSAGVKGHSASGKSYTVETVTKFFPPAAYITFTAMSERALVYSTEEFAHRTLIVYEVTALREGVEDDMTSYFLRSLLSEGRIDYDVTVRGPDGNFTTRKIVKQGPTNLIFTTTKTRVHAENETRILSLSTDDSREQTARVLLELADDDRSEADMQPWWDLQLWLAEQDNRVVIPYGRELARLIPPVAVRLRRDFGSVLALIRAHAVLHQATRRRDAAGRIVAELDDYAVVRDLIGDVVAEGVGSTVSDVVRQTVETVRALAGDEGVSVRLVAEKLSIDKSNASRRLRLAADGGYVRNREEMRGKPARWVVGDPLPEERAVLPHPAQLATAATPLEQECCGVALDSGEENERTIGPAELAELAEPADTPPAGDPLWDDLGLWDR